MSVKRLVHTPTLFGSRRRPTVESQKRPFPLGNGACPMQAVLLCTGHNNKSTLSWEMARPARALAEKALQMSHEILRYARHTGLGSLRGWEWFDTSLLLMDPFSISRHCVGIQPCPSQAPWMGPRNPLCDPSNVCFQVHPRTVEHFQR